MDFWNSFIEFWQWPAPLFLILGSLIGFLFGVLPGVGGTQVLALLIPISYGFSPQMAMILLIASMGACPLGGSITSILINTPGNGNTAAQMLDGYPLTKQGKAGVALGAASIAGVLGAIFGAAVLMLILPIGRQVVLAFSYPEFFMLALMGICIVGIVSEGSLWKSLISGGVGLMLSTIGMSAMYSMPRFTLGSTYLWDGISIVPVVVGMFAIPELIELFLSKTTIVKNDMVPTPRDIWTGVVSVFKNWGVLLRGSVIGTVIGIIPGVGSGVSTWVSYGITRKTAKNPEMFGKGDVRGVIAPEAANNANDGGALVPTLIFGIPGSAEMAVFLGALILHGLTPGPSLLSERLDVLHIVIITLVISNILVALITLFSAKYLMKITVMPAWTVVPIAFALVILGPYATDGHLGDPLVAVIFGLIGYFMRKYGYSRVALLIALVLGKMAEQSFLQTLMGMGWSGFFTRPISLSIFIVVLLVIFLPAIKKLFKKSAKEINV